MTEEAKSGPWTIRPHLMWCMAGGHVLAVGEKWRHDEHGRVCCALHYPPPKLELPNLDDYPSAPV